MRVLKTFGIEFITPIISFAARVVFIGVCTFLPVCVKSAILFSRPRVSYQVSLFGQRSVERVARDGYRCGPYVVVFWCTAASVPTVYSNVLCLSLLPV